MVVKKYQVLSHSPGQQSLFIVLVLRTIIIMDETSFIRHATQLWNDLT